MLQACSQMVFRICVLGISVFLGVQVMAEEPTPSRAHPQIVSVYPADGATEVAQETDVIVTFDQPMDPLGAKLEWQPSQSRSIVPLHYVPEGNQFIMRAHFPPGEVTLVVNGEFGPGPEGFCTPDGAFALPHTWRFTVRDNGGTPPAIVSLSPSQDAPTSILTFVEIAFDQPMLSIEDTHPWIDVCDENVVRGPELVYLLDPLAPGENPTSFRFPIVFPAHWHQEVTLRGFKSAKGIEAAPVRLKYTATEQLFSEATMAHLNDAAKDSRLVDLLRRMKRARANIHAVNETIQMIRTEARSVENRQALHSSRVTLQWREPAYFAMDVSRAMWGVFRMGNDGTTAWLAIQSDTNPHSKIETCSTQEIARKSVDVCDPFGLTTDTSETAINKMKLEYLGQTVLNNRSCHLVQRWDITVHEFGKDNIVCGRRLLWFIDAETLRPAQLVSDSTGGQQSTSIFTYERLNEEFPVEAFAPPTLAGVKTVPSPPLDADYNVRFFHADDGAGGTLSCRWGKRGPKGTQSSGIN